MSVSRGFQRVPRSPSERCKPCKLITRQLRSLAIMIDQPITGEIVPSTPRQGPQQQGPAGVCCSRWARDVIRDVTRRPTVHVASANLANIFSTIAAQALQFFLPHRPHPQHKWHGPAASHKSRQLPYLHMQKVGNYASASGWMQSLKTKKIVHQPSS